MRHVISLIAVALAAAGCNPSERVTPPSSSGGGATGTPVAPAPAAQAAQLEPGIPAYQKTQGVSGTVNSIGSDSMNNLMTLWGEAFRRHYANVTIQVEGKGSSTAPPALIEGTAQFGPMSRTMKPTEIDAFEKKYGHKPLLLRTGLDALAVYVNKDNPIEKLTLAQVDAAFSKTRKRGGKSADTWGGLGLTGDWASKRISLYGRNSASGTYGFFKEHALDKGDFRDTVKEQPGSASVVQGVAADRYGMGYSGIGYKTSDVKVVPLAEKDGDPTSVGSYDDVKSGRYALGRDLYVYINKAPGKPLDPLVREFMKLVYSQEGQGIVVKDGYLPLTAEMVKEELAKLE
jgi:phosphate transport system substrate-binding protein